MKVTNFKFITKDQKFASVDTIKTTGCLWWKKEIVLNRKIAKGITGIWFYLNDGDLCFEAEELEQAKIAQILLEQTLKKEQS